MIEDDTETKHLEALEGADSRLRLFQIDLLDYNSIVSALNGCAGVFHLASPCIVDQVQDPQVQFPSPNPLNLLISHFLKFLGFFFFSQRELLDPAIKGTKNVLTAAKEAGLGRVVVTSSISAIIPSPKWPADVIKGEDCWTDLEYCKEKQVSVYFYFKFQLLLWVLVVPMKYKCVTLALNCYGPVVVSDVKNISGEICLGFCQGERFGCCGGKSWHCDGPCHFSKT